MSMPVIDYVASLTSIAACLAHGWRAFLMQHTIHQPETKHPSRIIFLTTSTFQEVGFDYPPRRIFDSPIG